MMTSKNTFVHTHKKLLLVVLSLFVLGGLAYLVNTHVDQKGEIQELIGGKTEKEWQKTLTPLQYSVLRQKGTEAPYTGELLNEKRSGTYVTADCHEPVFRSEQKYDSETGWPSFWAPISDDAVEIIEDRSLGMVRKEVVSKKCKSHLGHVFPDGPEPTGLRYCINSAALIFIPDEE